MFLYSSQVCTPAKNNFFFPQKQDIFIKFLALSYHAGFCCQGQAVRNNSRNNSKSVGKVQAGVQGHRPYQEGGVRHCQAPGETPLRGRAARSSLWVWGPDGAGSSAPGEALGRGEEGAGRLRQKAKRRLSPRHPPEPQQPTFSQSFFLAPLGHDPRPRGPSGSIGFGGQNPRRATASHPSASGRPS